MVPCQILTPCSEHGFNRILTMFPQLLHKREKLGQAMSGFDTTDDRELPPPPYKMIARRIGLRLREEFERPEAEPLPMDHVDLLLRLRHKERERSRQSA
jgi:hypothetical protein